uniref:Uncharacterized protein n=1 Tax=Anopheles atroparvus TaxID=41427 RepID=A0A182IYN2_ANOAO
MAIAFYIPVLDDEAENQRLLQQQQMVLQQQLLLQQQYHLQAQLLQIQQSLAGQHQPQSATPSSSSPSSSVGSAAVSAATAPSTSTPASSSDGPLQEPPSTTVAEGAATATTSTASPQSPTTISNTPALHQNNSQLMRVALYDILFRHAMDTTPARSRCKLCSKLCYLLRKVC